MHRRVLLILRPFVHKLSSCVPVAEPSFRVVRFMLPSGEYEALVTSFPRNTFPSKTIAELYAVLTVFNFASRITSAAAIHKPPGKLYRANFKMAVFLSREFPKTPVQDGYEPMRSCIEPVRPGRADGRKLRPEGFAGPVRGLI